MNANRKIILLVALGAGACLLSFVLSQYVARRSHDDQLLLTQVQSLAPRVEHIRLLSRNFVLSGDTARWREIADHLDSLDVDIASDPQADRHWQAEVARLGTQIADYRRLLNQIHKPAVALNREKVKLQGTGLSFSRDVETQVIAPYRNEEGRQLYEGQQIDPFKNKIKDTAYEVMGLHLQQQLILLELMMDWDLDAYNRKKESIARAMAQHKTQLNYMNVLVGENAGFDTVIASLGQKMDRLVQHEKIIIGHYKALIHLNGELRATGDRLLRASEALTEKINSAISSANRLNRVLSWGLLVFLLGGLGIVGTLLSRDIIRFVKQIEASREALQQSEERLDLALEGADEGIWDWHLDSNRVEFDARYYTISGYEADEFPGAFEEWEKRVHPDDIRQVKQAVEGYLAGALDTYGVEFRFLRKDGDYMWIQGKGKIVARDEKGAPTRIVGTHADITRRKQMEESLRITQFIFDKAPLGIWRMGKGGEVLDVNEEGCASLGYKREELCRMSVFDFDPAMDSERWAEGTGILKAVGGRTIESLHQRKNGEIFPIQVVEKMVRFEDREVHVSFVQDITERKRNEEVLRKNYIQLKTIYNTLPIIIWAVDNNGVFTMSEGKELGTLGLKPEQVVGRSLFDLYKDNPIIVEHTERALNGEYCEYVSSVMGNYYHTILVPIINDDNKLQGSTGLAINVTEKRKDEEEIHHLRNYLANIIDSMPSVLVGVDPEGRVTQWNKETERVTGLLLDQATDKPLEAVYPQLTDQMEDIKTAIREGRVVRSPKVSRKTENDTRYEDITIFPLVDNGVEGAVIRVDDVTERVRLEEMMIQSEKMLSVGGLAAGMAHEINNPLAGIVQSASVLENRLLGDLPANRKAAEAAGITLSAIRHYLTLRKLPGMIENIRESGTRAAAIVRNMLSFARKSEKVVSNNDLGALLDQTIELLKTDYDIKKQYDFKQIELGREYEEDVPPVPCEASKLQQVFMNLLKNAAEAMAEATDSPDPPAFMLRVQDDEDWVRVEVEDNGPGMDETTRRRIFEPFFTTKPVGKGTGLGLSVSYFIITEEHGGEMHVQAADGGGTRFVIRLPKAGCDR